MVLNVHEREIAAPLNEVGALIDSLASKEDRFWPCDHWPPMRLDQALCLGAAGGHGPVRYFVSRYDPGRLVEFQFTSPAGFQGQHAFTAVGRGEQSTLLRHEITLSPKGSAIITWPMFFRPLHDALIEEAMDRAEQECGAPSGSPHRRSLWARVLRASFFASVVRR